MAKELKARTRPAAARREAKAPQAAGAAADEEQVRTLAYEIWQTRRERGMLGDPVTDWLDAERTLRERRAARGRRPSPPQP